MMCMANETIPPQMHFNTLNPMINIYGWGIIPAECLPWKGYGGDDKLLRGKATEDDKNKKNKKMIENLSLNIARTHNVRLMRSGYAIKQKESMKLRDT